MNTESSCEILYVDDEEKALKYFRMAFSSRYTVHTAPSAAEGLEILRQHSDRIGIVISDQRMPEMMGADFLGIVREQYPRIVRILTTAYSDLQSAIQAVNRGHIYQYVVKPWEVQDLTMILQRAADYHYVLSERDRLLSVKMSTLQRIICGDRLLWLLLSLRGLEAEAESACLRALKALIDAMPAPFFKADAVGAASQFEAGAILKSEHANAERCLSALAPVYGAVDPRRALEESVQAFISRVTESFQPSAPCEYSIAEGDRPSVNIAVASCEDLSRLEQGVFGLLLGRSSEDVSLDFFKLLVAAAALRGSVTLSIAGVSEDFSFPLDIEAPARKDELIDNLYRRLSVWDVATR